MIPTLSRLPVMDRARSSRRLVQTAKVERQYASQLRKIAAHVGELINTIWVPEDPAVADRIGQALERYAQIIEPWARVVGRRMVEEIDSRDRRAWREASAEMSRLMQAQLNSTDVGALTQQRLGDQVRLITSLPRDAAERVHKLTLEGLTQGTRAREIAAEIMRSGQVSKSRADLIARTEVSRTSTEFTRARAEDIGSTHFIWRTSRDSDVRPSHKALDGKTFRWDEPPECDPGHHALPGAIWNCRCFPEPVF
ncbi:MULTISPECIES: phage minor head protein [unclassified Novosphingobium]|uniref:phage head morphogenesis protein n=1 Tax=unclassified Novosphingobium TaxID=2644732 RepID=UPI0018EE8F15|nr:MULTISPECIES: phage minor head protein [unclassified Novosphingobium]